MGFFNWVHFLVILHVFAGTPIFSITDPTVTPKHPSFLDLAKEREVFDWMATIFRKIHENPELKYEEIKTSELIRTELENLGITYTHPVAKTGVIGYIGTGKPPFVALRADMDALPLQERVEWEHRSKVDGKMHACGHDAHVAMLLGAARIIKNRGDQIKGTIVLVFQPAEEGGAGAKKVVEEGVLKNVSAIFGLHVAGDMLVGQVSARSGPLLAASSSFNATIRGKGGHAALPQLSIDPIVATSSVIVSLQQLVSREADPLVPQVVTVSRFQGGGASNVIPDSVTIGGTVRALSKESFMHLKDRIEQVITGQAAVQRCTATVSFSRNYYPSVTNDGNLHKHFLKTAGNLLGSNNVLEGQQFMTSDDFAFYQEAFPGYYFPLGIKNEPGENRPSVHSSYFRFNEKALPYGAALHASLATSFLLEYDGATVDGKNHDELIRCEVNNVGTFFRD